MATKEKKKRPPRQRKAKPRQTVIPGAEEPRIEGVHDLAVSYIEVSEAWADAAKERTELAAKLADAMHTHKVKTYRVEDRVINLTDLTKIKIKKVRGDEASANGDGNGAAE